MDTSNVGSSIINYMDSTSAGFVVCNGLYATSMSAIYVNIYYTDTTYVYVGVIDLSGVTKTITYTLLIPFSGSSDYTYSAYFISSTSMYYVGYADLITKDLVAGTSTTTVSFT